MGNKFVTIDQNNIVEEPYDEDNNNVPEGAVSITDVEFEVLRNRGCPADFEIVDGALQLIAEADDNQKARVIDTMNTGRAMKAFVELMIDELNILRNEHVLADRTMAQFKTAMKAKLS